MTETSTLRTSIRVRFGLGLQRERQRHGLSQSQLAQKAQLSLKYVGEIERGEGNPTMDAVEAVCTALDWDPFELSMREEDVLPAGTRTLVLESLRHTGTLTQTAIHWLESLEGALARQRAQGAALAHSAEVNAVARRRGRPRKPKSDEPKTP